MSGWMKKRFWQVASVAQTDGGYGVMLDHRPLNTPAKTLLIVPSRALADAVAAEWGAVEGVIAPAKMPFTRAANAAIDKVAPQFEAVACMLADYGQSDLICHRAPAPVELVQRQAEVWDAWLDWAARDLAAPLVQGVGVVPIAQPGAALEVLRGHVRAHDPFELTALHDLVALSGSVILALAVSRRALAPQDAWTLSRIDEEWQASQWGRDTEADALAATRRAEFLFAAKLLHMLQGRDR